MPNKHYFVMLPVGYLDLRIDPFFNSINDDERLKEISNQLEYEIGEIIKNLEIPVKK